MTPREFLRTYRFDRRVVDGGYYPSAPLDVEEGETVGVVMMNLGGPRSLEEVRPFLYNLYMDPAAVELPVGGRVRDWLCRAAARIRARSARTDYELIGGSSPINRLTREQAQALEDHLCETYGVQTGVTFRTYTAMRYWHPSSEQAAAAMKNDGVDKVVLLPLYPHYSKTTTGSSMAYWNALDTRGAIPPWPTTIVKEYAANPKYVQALSERIDEGLQRFPRDVRSDVRLIFSAHGAPLRDATDRHDPYCCLVHATVDQVMHQREDDRPFHTAFRSRVGWAERLSPSTSDILESVRGEGARAVLVVPVAFLTDHLKTSYELDVEVREEAEAMGIRHYEVTSGLNAHPLLIEALGEATASQLRLPIDVNQLRHGGDGIRHDYPLRPLDTLPRYASEVRSVRCAHCPCVAEARCWHSETDRPVVEASEQRASQPEDRSPSSKEPSGG
jgi:ferrochelatase